MAYSVFYCEIYSMFYLLLALEYCCSFHLLATYIASFWPTWSVFIFLDSSVFYPMCPKNSLDIFVSFKCTVPIISWMFLFRLNDVVSFLKIPLKFSFICKIFQFFLMILVILGRNRLYVIMWDVLSDFCSVFFRNKVDSIK